MHGKSQLCSQKHPQAYPTVDDAAWGEGLSCSLEVTICGFWRGVLTFVSAMLDIRYTVGIAESGMTACRQQELLIQRGDSGTGSKRPSISLI